MASILFQLLPCLRSRRSITYRAKNAEHFSENRMLSRLGTVPYDILMYKNLHIFTSRSVPMLFSATYTENSVNAYIIKSYHTYFYKLKADAIFSKDGGSLYHLGRNPYILEHIDLPYHNIMYFVNMVSCIHDTKYRLVTSILSLYKSIPFKKIGRRAYFAEIKHNPVILLGTKLYRTHDIDEVNCQRLYTLYLNEDGIVAYPIKPIRLWHKFYKEILRLPKNENYLLYGYKFIDENTKEGQKIHSFFVTLNQKVIEPAIKSFIYKVASDFMHTFDVLYCANIGNYYIVDVMFEIFAHRPNPLGANIQQVRKTLQEIVHGISETDCYVQVSFACDGYSKEMLFMFFIPMIFIIQI